MRLREIEIERQGDWETLRDIEIKKYCETQRLWVAERHWVWETLIYTEIKWDWKTLTLRCNERLWDWETLKALILVYIEI